MAGSSSGEKIAVEIKAGRPKSLPLKSATAIGYAGEYEVIILFKKRDKGKNKSSGASGFGAKLSEGKEIGGMIKTKLSDYYTLVELIEDAFSYIWGEDAYKYTSEFQGLIGFLKKDESNIFRSSLFGIDSIVYSYLPTENRPPTLEFNVRLPLAVLRLGQLEKDKKRSIFEFLPFLGDKVWVGVFMPSFKVESSENKFINTGYTLVFEGNFFINTLPRLSYEGVTTVSINYSAIHSDIFTRPAKETDAQLGEVRGDIKEPKIDENKSLNEVLFELFKIILGADSAANFDRVHLNIYALDTSLLEILKSGFAKFLSQKPVRVSVVSDDKTSAKQQILLYPFDSNFSGGKKGGKGGAGTVKVQDIPKIGIVAESLYPRGSFKNSNERWNAVRDNLQVIVSSYLKAKLSEGSNFYVLVSPPLKLEDEKVAVFEIFISSGGLFAGGSSLNSDFAVLKLGFDFNNFVSNSLGSNIPVYPVLDFDAGDFVTYIWTAHYLRYFSYLDTTSDDVKEGRVTYRNINYLPLVGVRVSTFLAPFVNLFDIVVFDEVNFPYVGLGGPVIGVEHVFWGGELRTSLVIVSYFNFSDYFEGG